MYDSHVLRTFSRKLSRRKLLYLSISAETASEFGLIYLLELLIIKV